MQFAPQTVNKLQQAAGFGFDNGFHHQVPVRIQNGDHRRFLVHVHADILADILNVTIHVSCLLWGEAHSCQRLSSPEVKLPWFSPAF
jgi:hypothetical protein